MQEKIQLSLLQRISAWWNNLNYISKVVAIMGILCVITGAYYLTQRSTIKNQVAVITDTPATPPIEPVSGIHLETTDVLLHANSIDFIVGNSTIRSFNTTPTPTTLGSEHSTQNPNYTALNARWMENGQEYSLRLTFEAVFSNERFWRLNQINTVDPYNGSLNWNSDSIELFAYNEIQSSLNLNTLVLTTSSNDNLRLQINNLVLLAFLQDLPSYVSPYPSPSLPSNCHFQQVQCVRAPCRPVMVCDSPYPSPSISTTCTHQTPTLSISPNEASTLPGGSITYTGYITNHDSQACASSLFAIATQVPSDFTALNQPTMWIPAGATAQTSFTVTSPLTNPWNEARSVPVTLRATNTSSNMSSSSNAAYNLLMPRPQTFDMYFKLAGVSDGSADGTRVSVKFYLKNGTVRSLSGPLTLYHTTGNTYKSTVTITNPFPPGTDFRLKVKAEKHIAIEFCKSSGQTAPCGDNDYISIPTNQQDSYMLSLTGIPLPPGDLPPQDGRANIDDLNLLKPLMQNSQSSLTEANLSVADVNYDDYINIFDVFLILKTMETRYDE